MGYEGTIKRIRWSANPAKRLEELADARQELDDLIDKTVIQLRERPGKKMSWQEIARILGLSVSTARRRFDG